MLQHAQACLILGLLVTLGCEGPLATKVALPPLPTADTSGLEPAVRQQISAARATLDADPASAAANGALGAIFHAYNWLEQAKVCYRRATILDPGTFRWWYCLGRVLIETGERRDGIDAVRRSVSLKDDYTPAALFLGDLALKDEDLDEARRWIVIASKLSPRSPHVLNALGQLASKEGKTDEAIRRYKDALELAPLYGSACYGLALAYRASGDLENAKIYLERHSSSDKLLPPPDPILEEVQALRRDSDSVLRSANALMKRKDYAKAVQRYAQVLELNPALIMAEYDIGLALQRLNEPRKAAAHYEAFLRLRPDSVDALNNLGLCFYETGRPSESIEYFQRAVAIDPQYAKGYFNLGLACLKVGKTAEAVSHFETTLSIRPRDAEAHWSLGLVLKQSGRREEAMSHFFQVLEVRPDDERAQGQLLSEIQSDLKAAGARRALANLLKGKGLFKAAISVLERELRGKENDAETAVELAWLLATCPDATVRKPKEAVRWVEPLCNQSLREDPRAFDALASAFAALGRFEEATRAAERALRLAETQNGSPVTLKLAEDIRARLKLYQEKKPYLEP